MTANFRTIELEPPLASSKSTSTRARQTLKEVSDRIAFPATILALLVIYGLLQNRYWVPSGDSEVYISIARNLARGDGYRFNGQPVAMVPPGWPVVMAAVMKVTPYFLPLKLLAMGCMIGFFAIGYWIIRRFTTPQRAANAILITAILSVVYPATYWLISEGLFCLLSAAAILLAMQINEGRQQAWRIALLALCCAAAVTVRWAGVIGMILVAAALIRGEWKPRLTRPWVAIVIAALASGVTFVSLRHALQITPQEAEAAREYGGTAEDTGAPAVALTDKQVAGQYKLITGTAGSDGYGQRLVNWGRWFSFLFWQPFRAAGALKSMSLVCNAVGWMVILLIALTATLAAIRQKQWIWIALLVYCGALALNWPIPNARYLVPVSFLLTLGVFLGADHLRDMFRHPAARAAVAGALYLFVAGTVLCNGALYGMEVSVEQSRDLYAVYEAGLNQNLIAASRFLSDRGVKDGEVAVSSRYQNLGRTRSSPFGLRATTMLTGRAIVSVPWQRIAPPNPRLRSWLNNQKIGWYLYQPPVTPWRVWHLRRLGAWLEEKATGVPPGEDQAGWRLYRVDDDKMPEVVPPPAPGWPTRVPGL